MSAKKVIVVFGATGNQGGSVAKSILSDPKLTQEWTVRGVTRDVSKPAAKKLESLGAETVAADINDAAAVRKAVEGAYAVFAVTDYWQVANAEAEYQQGKTIVDAAIAAGVQHFVWSSLLNITKLSNGALPNVYHFDSKARVEEYIRSTSLPASFVLPGMFMNLLPGGMFRPGPDGNWTMSVPVPGTAPTPLLDAADDVGKFVKGILLNREKTLGKRVLAATDYYTFNRIVDEFKELFPEAGKGAQFYQLPHEAFKGYMTQSGRSEEVAQEMLENMRLFDEFGYYGGESLEFSHSLLQDKLTTWKDFARKAPAFAELK